MAPLLLLSVHIKRVQITRLSIASVVGRTQPNQSLELTENAACFSTARKNLFREMAAFAARIVYDDLAVRRRSLAPVR